MRPAIAVAIGVAAILLLMEVGWLTLFKPAQDKAKEHSTEVEKEIYFTVEKAYFEGQLDAVSGDVRIARITDSSFVWTRSPWDTGKEPVFNPDYETIKKSNINLHN